MTYRQGAGADSHHPSAVGEAAPYPTSTWTLSPGSKFTPPKKARGSVTNVSLHYELLLKGLLLADRVRPSWVP